MMTTEVLSSTDMGDTDSKPLPTSSIFISVVISKSI